MKHLVLIAAASLSFAGCATIAGPALDALVSVAKPAATTGDKIVVEGTRGLILAHNAAQGGIALVNPLVRKRVLTAAQVDRYEWIINRVEELAVTGRTSLTTAQRATELFNLADELNKLGGR